MRVVCDIPSISAMYSGYAEGFSMIWCEGSIKYIRILVAFELTLSTSPTSVLPIPKLSSPIASTLNHLISTPHFLAHRSKASSALSSFLRR